MKLGWVASHSSLTGFVRFVFSFLMASSSSWNFRNAIESSPSCIIDRKIFRALVRRCRYRLLRNSIIKSWIIAVSSLNKLSNCLLVVKIKVTESVARHRCLPISISFLKYRKQFPLQLFYTSLKCHQPTKTGKC